MANWFGLKYLLICSFSVLRNHQISQGSRPGSTCMQVSALRWLHQPSFSRYLRALELGHQPIVLLGGGTTRIGDPSGKDKTRKILLEKEIEMIL